MNKKVLKKIKKVFKKEKIWREYKKQYGNSQFFFIASKIVMIFRKDFDLNLLIEIEKKIFYSKLEKEKFLNAFIRIKELINMNIDFHSLSQYVWFQVQGSNWISRKKIKSIYNIENFTDLNSEKRDYFLNVVKSLEKYNEQNKYVIDILKVCS